MSYAAQNSRAHVLLDARNEKEKRFAEKFFPKIFTAKIEFSPTGESKSSDLVKMALMQWVKRAVAGRK